MLYGIIQVRDHLARHGLGSSCVARICVSSNLAVFEEIRWCAVLILAGMYNIGLQREGRVYITSSWERYTESFISMIE